MGEDESTAMRRDSGLDTRMKGKSVSIAKFELTSSVRLLDRMGEL